MQSKTFIFVFCFLLASTAMAGDAWLGFSFKDRGGSGGQPCSLEVATVHEASGSAQAGIQAGDLVIQLDGKPIASLVSLKAKMKSARVGTHLKMSYIRKGKVSHADVVLTARPDDIRKMMGSHVGSKAYPLGKNFYANAAAVQKAPKAILLDFWATWCGPCRASIPMIRDIYSRRKSQGLEVIGLSTEAIGVLNDFQKMEKEPWPLYQDIGGQQSSRWGVRAIPTLILLDGNWIVQKVWQGPPSPQELDLAVSKLL